jgi:hypothetical protein
MPLKSNGLDRELSQVCEDKNSTLLDKISLFGAFTKDHYFPAYNLGADCRIGSSSVFGWSETKHRGWQLWQIFLYKLLQIYVKTSFQTFCMKIPQMINNKFL